MVRYLECVIKNVTAFEMDGSIAVHNQKYFEMTSLLLYFESKDGTAFINFVYCEPLNYHWGLQCSYLGRNSSSLNATACDFDIPGYDAPM